MKLKNWWKLIPVTTVKVGEMIPWWAGGLWFNYLTGTLWVTVIPFNLPIRLLHMLWIWFKHPIRFFDAAYEADYQKRVNVGYRKGWCARGWCDKREWKTK